VHSSRTVVLAAGAVVAATLLALLAAAVVVAPALAHRLVARQAAVAPVSRPGAELRRGETFVTVLNGSGRAGAAQDAAARVQSLGYAVANVGNAAGAATTEVLFRRGYRREALRLARDVGVTAVRPLTGVAPSRLLGAQLALVLGS
jgi:hypothetical protein